MGKRFSAPVQTGPGAYLASYTMGTRSFPGVKRPGRGVDHPPPSSAEVNERVKRSDGTSNKASNIIKRHIDNRELLLTCILLLSHSLIFSRFIFLSTYGYIPV